MMRFGNLSEVRAPTGLYQCLIHKDELKRSDTEEDEDDVEEIKERRQQ